MKHLLLLSIVILVPFHAPIAEELSVPAVESSADLSQECSADPAAADVDPSAPIFEMGGSCTATADCGVHGDLTCNGSSSCSFVDRSCFLTAPPQGGHVTCDGVTTQCPSNSACESDCWDDYWDCLMQPEGSIIECREDRAACICFC